MSDEMSDERWTAGDIPDQSGPTAMVTGANTGWGLETARDLQKRLWDVSESLTGVTYRV